MHTPSVAPCFTTSLAGVIVEHDERLSSLLDEPDLAGRQLESFGSTEDDVRSICACLQTGAADGVAGRVRVRLKTSTDREVSVHLVVAPHTDTLLTIVLIDETSRADAEEELARSERRWLSLLRDSADIVFTTDPEGSLTTVTSALPERLGWMTDEVVGRPGLRFVHADDRGVARQAWDDVSAGRTAQVTLEIRLIHENRTTTWARVVISDLRDDPDVRSVIGNVTDITEQKMEEANRHHEAGRFRARFDQSPVAQVLQAIDGTYQSVNDAFCTLLGRSREELVGVRSTSVTHPDDPGDAEVVLAGLRRGEVESVQVNRVFADVEGRPVPVLIDATVLRDTDGTPSGCAASLHDLRQVADGETPPALQNLFNAVAERSRDLVMLHDADGTNLYSSPAGFDLFGERYAGTTEELLDLVHPDDLEDALHHWGAVQLHPWSRTWRFRARGADDQWIWIEAWSTNMLDTGANAIISSMRDVTASVEAAEAVRISEARYRAIAETAEEGILVTETSGIVTYANARAASIFGVELGRLLGMHVLSILEGPTIEDVAKKLRDRHVLGPERYELPYHHPDGTWRALLVGASPMPEVEGRNLETLAMITDITELRRNERKLRHAATHDDLTGLLNRTMLLNHIGRPDTPGTAVLFIDLDHFKGVNDGRGHSAGDDVLVEVASRLRAVTAPGNAVGRCGGDEFVVVLRDVDADTAQTTAQHLLDVISAPYTIGHHYVRIGATIGIALSPADSADHLMRHADIAMYAAKRSPHSHVRLYDTALTDEAEERYDLGAELLKALTSDGLEMHYQPVIDITTGEATGVEALARWPHPTRGLIKPSQFVALAEMNASAADLDRWVVRRSMRDIAELKAIWVMPEPATVAINLSGQSLTEGLDAFIVGVAAQAGLDPGTIILEITESAIMADKDVAIAVLERLRDHGFGIAIDDFGTGYSSMAYLRDLPITVLKIDRGFVRDIPHDAHSLAIVTSLIELARSLDLTVVAEGVETPEQLDALRAHGCIFAQGWLWSKAATPAELQTRDVFRHRIEPDTHVPE